jgi:hypothetical protein
MIFAFLFFCKFKKLIKNFSGDGYGYGGGYDKGYDKGKGYNKG